MFRRVGKSLGKYRMIVSRSDSPCDAGGDKLKMVPVSTVTCFH